MRLCQHCNGEIPPEARADAAYCSQRCKLKAQRLRKKAAVSTENVPGNTDTASAACVPIAPASPTPKAETVAPDPVPFRWSEPVLPFNHTEQLAFPFGPVSTVATAAQVHTTPNPAPVTVEKPGEGQSVRASAPADSRAALPPTAAPHAASAMSDRTKPVTAPPTPAPNAKASQAAPRPPIIRQSVSSPPPSPVAVAPAAPAAPAAPTTNSPLLTATQTTISPAAQSIADFVGMIIQHVKATERQAAERRAKETPEEKQQREKENARARERLKRFDRFM